MNARNMMVAAGLIGVLASAAQAGRVEPVKNLEKALKTAKAENKLLFVQYGREACGNCQALKGMIREGTVRLRDSQFVYADVNCDDQATSQVFFKQFKVDGRTLPFVVIADPSGKQLAARTGYGEAQEFEDLIRAAEKKMPKPEKAGVSVKAAKPAGAAKIKRDESRAARTWKAKAGAEVEASLIEESGEFLVLKKSDGSTLKIRPANLSDDDQAYVKQVREGGAGEAAVAAKDEE
jgi:thioredoxin-related protein